MTNLTKDELASLVAAVVTQIMQGQAASPKPAIYSPVDKLAQKDRSLIAGFVRRGIKREDIKLMDRSNPAADYNIRPFQSWLKLGYQVRKGQHGIRGLFHVSQCDRIAPKAPAKPAITNEEKSVIEQAKKILKAKKGAKAQPTLV
jgi:hypothetical protein